MTIDHDLKLCRKEGSNYTDYNVNCKRILRYLIVGG